MVMTPEVRILGDPDIHVKEGSKVRIECVISNTTDHVPYVTWLLNNQVQKQTIRSSVERIKWDSKRVKLNFSVLNDKYI